MNTTRQKAIMTDRFADNNALWNRATALRRLGGNEFLLNKIADMFLLQIEQKQKAVNDAVSALDVEAIRFHSHALKGVSGDVGADALKERAAQMEFLAKEGDLNEITDHLTNLNTIIQATIELIRSHR